MQLFHYRGGALVALMVSLSYFGGMKVDAAAGENQRIYIGTYTGGKSQGIYRASFDSQTGQLGQPELAVKTQSPSFLAIHPKAPVLYAVGEGASIGPKKQGSVSAFKIGVNGDLELLNQQPSGGGGPCHVAVDKTGRCVLVANYGSGSVAALPISDSGALGEPTSVIQHEGSSVNPRRQSGPHGHFITPDPDNKFALACDLGLDKVLVYKLTPEGAMLASHTPQSAPVASGAGPRHLVFDPTGRFVHVINEMGSSVTTFSYDGKNGVLRELGSIPTLPSGFVGESSCAEIQVHPSGKFIYASNRGHDSIAVFAVDSGALTLVEHASTQGKTPRHFALDPSGKWLLAENQDSDTIVVFAVDPKSGGLKATGQSAEVGKPVCVVFYSR